MVTIRIFSGFPQYYKTLYSKNPSRKLNDEFSPTSYAGGWDSNKKRPHTSRQVASETYFWQSMSRVFPYKSIKLKFPSHDV